MSDPTDPLYLSLDEMKALLGIPPEDTTQDARLTALLTVASRAIDIHCRRTFYLRSETHRYDAVQLNERQRMERTAYPYPWGRATMRLWLDDDLHAATSVINGD